MKKSDIKAWFEQRIRQETVGGYLGAIGLFGLGLVAGLLTWVGVYIVAVVMTFRLDIGVAHGPAVMGWFVIGLMFVVYFMKSMVEHRQVEYFEVPVGDGKVSVRQPDRSLLMTSAFNSSDTPNNLVIVATALTFVPALFFASFEILRRTQQFRTLATAAATKVFAAILADGERVTLSELFTQSPKLPADQVFPMLYSIDGVVLTENPPTLSISEELKRELAEFSLKRRGGQKPRLEW